MLTNPPPAHTHTNTLHYTVRFQLSLGGPTLLIPVLDSRNGTETKVILHLPLLPLAFHLPPPFLLPPKLSEKDVSGSEHAQPEKQSPVGHLSTDGKGFHQPIQGDWYWPQSVSEAPVQHRTARSARFDTSWWRTWSEFKGGWICLDHGGTWKDLMRRALPPPSTVDSYTRGIYIYTHIRRIHVSILEAMCGRFVSLGVCSGEE